MAMKNFVFFSFRECFYFFVTTLTNITIEGSNTLNKKDMKKIPFYKMSGSGNDFILIDNRDGIVEDQNLKQLVVGACRRKMSVGADGLLLIEKSNRADFKWQFYNADGSRAEMCGNGARCAGRFAFLAGIAGPQLSFETDAGIVTAEVSGDRVKIGMTDPTDLKENETLLVGGTEVSYDFINTGVPHVVITTSDIERIDVFESGRAIRYHEAFSPAGTNVNFMESLGEHTIAVRTYERGVEDETLACGTGCVAASLMMCLKHQWSSPVDIRTRSKAMLRVYYTFQNGVFTHVYLEGDARVIYQGILWEEAWEG
jgi:diaminopimelate epimerase